MMPMKMVMVAISYKDDDDCGDNVDNDDVDDDDNNDAAALVETQHGDDGQCPSLLQTRRRIMLALFQ